jgi:hypothetical protein
VSDPPATDLDHAAFAQEAGAAKRRLDRRFNLISALRFVTFVVLALAVAGIFNAPGALPIIGCAILGAVFIALALWHGRVADRQQYLERLARYHQRGLDRQQGRWDHGQNDGDSFAQAEHSYARDLDVVGPRGLYQLMNTAASADGQKALADLLLDDSADGDAEVVRDLSAMHRWRAELFALGHEQKLVDKGVDDAFRTWLQNRPAILPAWARSFAAVLRLVAWAALAYAGWFHSAGGFIWTAIALAFAYAPINVWAALRLGLDVDVDRLRTLVLAHARRLAHIAALKNDTNERVRVLAETAAAGAEANVELARYVEFLAKRRNPLWHFGVGAILLSEWSAGRRIQAWAERHAEARDSWSKCLAQAETWSCIATYAAEQGGCWATVDESGPALSVEGLAHPLLPRATRVANDITLKPRQVLLLTGANASGKSTFLRSLALMSLMARIGAPVQATRCSLRRMRLSTVMRVQDDLAAGSSRFQAEVRAIKRCFDRIGQDGAPLLVALDEILGGTNSHERHLGTEAVLSAMRAKAALILISTHDLELFRLAEKDPEQFVLAHFADDAGGDNLVFDYRLRPGLVRTTNALKVMKLAGLPVEIPDKQARGKA